MLTCLCLAGCGDRDKSPALSQAQQTAKDKLESFQKMAAQTAQAYKSMDIPALLNKLAEQSAAKKEPFNSPAYRELKGRTDVPADSLVSLVNQTKNGNALLPLLLLRKLHEKEYTAISPDERAAVLTDALQNSKTFNTWGMPGIYLEDASKAMLETGKSAYPALKRMLSDTRPAPVFGGQQHMVYEHYKFRVCDYALFFLEKMQGNENFRMPESVADRDTLIKKMLN